MKTLDRKKPFGSISGVLDNCPMARFTQNGAYYNASGEYLMDTTGEVAVVAAVEKTPLPEVPDEVAAALKGTIIEVSERLPLMTNEQLQALRTAETSQKARLGLLSAIDAELESREPVEPPSSGAANPLAPPPPVD